MTLITKEVEVCWHNKTRKHYEGKGYVFTKKFDKFIVTIKDLFPGSRAKIQTICDCCGKIKEISFGDYNRVVNSNNGMYICLPCTRKRSGETQRTDIEKIRKLFDRCDLILISHEYKPGSKLKYECKKHPGIIQEKSLSNIRKLCGCPICKGEALSKRNSGKDHFNWQGGISSLSKYLRNGIGGWKYDSMKACDFKCVLTGKEFDAVHHLTSFDTLMREMMEEIGMDIRENISMYTYEELEMMSNRIVAKHNDYGLGICVNKDLHNLFHKLYGKGGNTVEQWNSFVSRYKVGEFSE